MRFLNQLLCKFFCAIICVTSLGGTAGTQPTAKGGGGSELVVESGETNGVKLTVTMHRRYASGETIPVEFTLENNRDETIILNHSDTPRDINIRLMTYKGDLVPYTPFGRRYDAGSPYEFTRNLTLHLGPHHTMNWCYNLEDYFVIPNEGYFRLYVLRTVDGFSKGPSLGGEDQEVDVGPLRFWVK